MEVNQSRFRYELFVLLFFLALGGLFWFFEMHKGIFRSQSETAPIQRQTLPPASALEIPPSASLPPYEHPFFARITPSSKPKENAVHQDEDKLIVLEKPHKNIPTRGAIINRHRQEIELDYKYFQIAVDSDRTGYRNQAIAYYQKYLNVSPMGPHASQVRTRLSELENSP